MKKCIVSLLLTLCLVFGLSCYAFADSSGALYDYEGLLSADEADDISAALEYISSKYDMTVAILTVSSLGSKTAEEYADDFYDENDLGVGDDRDGLILLVSMAERQWYISTSGYAIYAFPDLYLDDIGESITPYLSDGDCAGAFDAFIENCDYYLDDSSDDNYDYSDEDFYYVPDGRESSGPRIIWVPIAIGIGLIIALIVMSILKRGMKSVDMQTAAADYIVGGSFSLSESRDIFLYTTVTKTPKPKDDDDDDYGGFGAGGNFSSTHMSGGGSIHGGRGGSF